MLTAKTDYTYIDWSASDMSDADVRGIIMPTEDARNKQHGLRKEDFAYMLEAIYQIRYAGTWQTQMMTTITPSVDSQNRLKNNLSYLSGYISGTQFFSMMCVQDGNIYETPWRNIGRVSLIEDGIAQFVPSNKLIDFSTLNIQPDENKIDDELMTRMYSILGQSMVYTVPTSFKSFNYGEPPMLGVWSFSGTLHDETYKEDGTKDTSRSTTTPFTTNKPGGPNTRFGVAIQQPVYPNTAFSMSRTYSTKSDGTYFMSGKMYMTGTSLTLAVPSGTTDCWVYVISWDVYGTRSQPYTARMIEASVNAAGDRATISGFGSDADVNSFISLGNYSSPVQSGNWQLSIGAVFCKVNAKWHWW